MNHKNWYTQRYSKTNPAISQSLQDKLDNFKQIDEYNKQKKENLVNKAIAFFTQHNIPYQPKNENTWIVTLFNQNYYYYPKSGKFKPSKGTTTYYSKGAEDFLNKVKAYHQ